MQETTNNTTDRYTSIHKLQKLHTETRNAHKQKNHPTDHITVNNKSSNISVTDEYRLFFNFMLPSEKIEKRRIGFETKFSNCICLFF